MRNTKQKTLVLEIVNHSVNHPTAFEIYQECIKVIPNISLGTVYRNLNSLVDLGKIQKLDIPNHITCYDKKISHDHFICMKCGKIIDLEKKNIYYDKIPNGHKILDYKIQYEGICCDCLKLEKESEVYGTKGK